MDQTDDVRKSYDVLMAQMNEYQAEQVAAWCQRVEGISEEKLDQPLLVEEDKRLRVNFDPQLVRLLRETKYFLLLKVRARACVVERMVVHLRACVQACVRAGVRACRRACVRERVCVCIQPASCQSRRGRACECACVCVCVCVCVCACVVVHVRALTHLPSKRVHQNMRAHVRPPAA